MNKKGEFSTSLPWIARIFVMVIAIIVIGLLISVYRNRDVDPPALARASYLYRLYYDDIIMYSDKGTGRVYPGIVDYQKFNDATLDAVFEAPVDERAKISSRLTLTPAARCVTPRKVIYNSRKTFEQYELLIGVQDKGGATMEEVVYPVTIRGTTDCDATLTITIVRPNS